LNNIHNSSVDAEKMHHISTIWQGV